MRSDSVYSKMALEPLRSALSLGEVGETSLALPSDRTVRSAQQRVLEQVSTMKRTKSKYSSSSSKGGTGTLSPSSPQSDSVFYEYKFFPGTLNGSAIINENSMANGHAKVGKQSQNVIHRTISTRTSNSQRNLSSSMFPCSPPAASQPRVVPDGYTASRSLEMVPSGNTASARWSQTNKHTSKVERKPSHPLLNGTQIIGNNTVNRNSTINTINLVSGSQTVNRRPPSSHSNPEVKASVTARSKSESNGVNAEARSTELTLPEAMDCLFSQDENYQLFGASFIQHSTFTDDKAKQEVLKMKGIAPLVSLMSSPNPRIQQTAASALRNLVFKNQANKEEVQRCGGITQAVQLLKHTDSAETQKHVAGLLWNLSSVDSLKPELLRSALPVLTETILEPFAASADHTANPDLDPESFYNATGCLRNLSSGKPASRQAMRNCKGLVDSLVSYVQNCADSCNHNDKSVENCVCILHNLTYQLESEAPAVFSKMNALAGYANRRTNTTDTGPIGCFSSQSRKIQQENFDYPVMEDNNPKGQSWLIHSRALQSYLSLLGSSEREITQEACCGALHNLTANKGVVSDVLSQTIVQKLNGLQHISPLLQSSNPNVRGSVTSLLGNLSRTPRLQSIVARQALPQLVRTLTPAAINDLSPESDSTIATTCNTINNLLRVEPEMSKQLLGNPLINSLNDISQNIALPKASKAAGVLLHSLWSEKNIQSFLKKQGMNKRSFVNEVTSAALRSVQVIE
ncbi:plakophilin-1 isoform X1 [Pygocentrus nattereri]|uniref:Plakophilin 1b n=2 Tax=Pygocentrus nattereri TaxID=42514 RepID=A0A3B4BRT3_PYGNA|nr:plakophilin-1 isoform X1 [Pygocentrus nattereri]